MNDRFRAFFAEFEDGGRMPDKIIETDMRHLV